MPFTRPAGHSTPEVDRSARSGDPSPAPRVIGSGHPSPPPRARPEPRMVSPMTTATPALPADQVSRLARGEHHDPHSILGAHHAEGGTVVRAYHPDANAAWLVAPNGGTAAMKRLGEGGLWEGLVPDLAPGRFTYR